jgi:tRNA-guanine family transglycosylase
MNAAILTSLHNLAFYFNLMKGIREAIKQRQLARFSNDFLARFNADVEE